VNRQQQRKRASQTLRAAPGAPPAEDIALALHLAAVVRGRRPGGGRGPFGPVLDAISEAERLVLARPLASLAENMRLTDLSVTVHSLEDGAPFPGRTWIEWDAGLDDGLGRPAVPLNYDRVGVLAEADATGQRGVMHVLIRTTDDGQPALYPIAAAYDLREDYEPPPTLLLREGLEEMRRRLAGTRDLTPAEAEGSAVSWTATCRRFGIVESAHAEPPEVGQGILPWHRARPEMLVEMTDEVVPHVFVALLALLLLRTGNARTARVPAGAWRKRALHGVSRVPFDYTILDLAEAAGLAPGAVPGAWPVPPG